MSGIRVRVCIAVVSALGAVGCKETTGTSNSADAGDDSMTTGGGANNNGNNANGNNANGNNANGNNANGDDVDSGSDCEQGYTRKQGECVDIDECAKSSTCDANATCTNSEGSFSCACGAGYAGNGRTCTDVDECATDNGGCGDAARYTCTNLPGGAPSCADTNECLVDNGGCGHPAAYACTNNVGAAPGCSEIGACLTSNGGCGDAALTRCSYAVDGAVVCTDIDECATDNGGCGAPADATCVNQANKKNTCVDVNECATAGLNNCTVANPCVNVKSGHYCSCVYPQIFDGASGCRAARVLVLDDSGGTTLLADLQAEGFTATSGGLYYEWNQSPNLSGFDTVLWLEGNATTYGRPLLAGVDELVAAFVKAGNGLIRTEWGLWYASTEKSMGVDLNPKSVAVMPVALSRAALFVDAGSSWTVTNASSPLTLGLPATIVATGGFALLDLLPGSEAVATTLDSRTINSVVVETVVPVISYTSVNGGLTVHVNDTLLYSNGTRTTLPADIKKVYFNAVHFTAQRVIH